MLSLSEDDGAERAKRLIERYARASGEVKITVQLGLTEDDTPVLNIVVAQGEEETHHPFLPEEFPRLLKTIEILDTSLWPGQFAGLRTVLDLGWDAGQERIRALGRKVLV